MAAQNNSKCEKLRILRRIVYKVTEEKINVVTTEKDLNISGFGRAIKYTGLHWKVLGDLNLCSSLVIEIGDVDRLIIYFELVNFYLTQKCIPTTRKLFNALYKKIPPYIDIGNFRKILVKMDFMWKQSQYGCIFVIERPEVVIERYHYLKNILQFRKDEKDIYFIDENALEATCGYLSLEQSNRLAKRFPSTNQQRVIFAVSKKGMHCVKFISSFDEETFQNWIIEDLLPFLSTSSVIVYNNSKHHCRKIAEIPTLDSLKIEMTEWLQRNEVPFDPDMSKYELFSLIESCTDVNENIYKIDRIIEAYGHRVLRIPNCIKKMTPTNLLGQIISKNAKQIIFNDSNTWHENVVDNCNKLIESIPFLKFIEFNDIVKRHENIIYNTDKAVDIVFDNLVERISSIKINDENDSEIPSCSDSE